MPLSATNPVSRIRNHTRSVRFEGYARADRLRDIEAHLTDIKPDEYLLAPGVRLHYPRGQRAAKIGAD